MFGIGWTELIIIVLVALIVVGPERMPDLARRAGKTVGDLRRMYAKLRSDLGPEYDEIEQHVRSLRSLDPRRELTKMGQSALNGFSDDIGPEVRDALPKPGAVTFENLMAQNQQPAAEKPVAPNKPQPVQVERLGHDILNDALLDEPLSAPASNGHERSP